MLSVLPFDVPVSCLLERVRVKTGSQCKLAEPTLHRNVNAVRCRIADDKTHQSPRLRDPTQRNPHLSHITEVSRDHGVIRLLAAVDFTLGREPTTHTLNLIPNWIELGLGQDILGFWTDRRDVLGARANQILAYSSLQVSPSSDLAREGHFESSCISVIVIVRVGRRRNHKLRPPVWDFAAHPRIILAKLGNATVREPLTERHVGSKQC